MDLLYREIDLGRPFQAQGAGLQYYPFLTVGLSESVNIVPLSRSV
jgi:hypothetical protein